MDVTIHYCTRWGYEPRAAGLADAIEKRFGARPKLVRGSDGIFDVLVDGRRIFSKHEALRFPELPEILSLLAKDEG